MGSAQALASNLPADEVGYLEDLYERWRSDPQSVPADWRSWFDRLDGGLTAAAPTAWQAPQRPPARPSPAPVAAERRPAPSPAPLRLFELVEAWRAFGHRAAHLDPLAPHPPPRRPELLPATYGFTDADQDTEFDVGGLFGRPRATLRQVLALLERTWAGSVGIEFMHIDEPAVRRWVAEAVEAEATVPPRAERVQALRLLTRAEVFEQFLQTKFLGVKRFSLEGGEALIPLLDRLVERAGDSGTDEVVLGMAHRGRLNVLANVLGKPVSEILREFQDMDAALMIGRGDVKYHLGHSADRVLASGRRVHLSLAFNPSHLEAIGPVLEGRVRARQDRAGDERRERVLPLVVHGDAAFAGQGVIAECLNISGLPATTTGGTVHVVVNNQVGFTTPPEQGRSSTYATGIARMLDIPVFHVNGEDPDAVARVADIALAFRQRFHRDVVVDLWCWRKYGHNEGDEPAFTQPLMYAAIAKHPGVRATYARRLVEQGIVSASEADAMISAHKVLLEKELERSRQPADPPAPVGLAHVWRRYRGGPVADAPAARTGVAKSRLQELARALVQTPAGFQPHPKVRRGVLELRAEMGEGKRPLDWGMAEALALASLVTEGTPVRFTGQDSERGTFSHRHAVLHDARDGRRWCALQHLSPDQGRFEIHNSALSEYAALGFEYGYSLDYPEGLVVWEAQFGDFVNGAQIILDQFLSSAEDKWNRLSGLVLLLPHGFEGQGPEHSSARLERFLSLSAEDNWQVAYPSTPAQYFHLLRRQVVRPWRKPLVVMTPKSLLRQQVSTLEDLGAGFEPVLGDRGVDPARVRTVLVSSGKVYWDLVKARETRGDDTTALVRLEQLYPFPAPELSDELARYGSARRVAWVQEEPWNMGAWFFLRAREPELRLPGGLPLECVSRPESASPATGSHRAHAMEQERLLDQALGPVQNRAETGRAANLVALKPASGR